MSEPKKKKYEAPQLTKVSLRPEEAVLGACKISSANGPIGNCTTSGCHSLGS